MVIVTTEHRGVFAGEPAEALKDKQITLKNARMCVYWSSDVKGIVGLAATGPTKGCKVTAPALMATRTTQSPRLAVLIQHLQDLERAGADIHTYSLSNMAVFGRGPFLVDLRVELVLPEKAQIENLFSALRTANDGI